MPPEFQIRKRPVRLGRSRGPQPPFLNIRHNKRVTRPFDVKVAKEPLSSLVTRQSSVLSYEAQACMFPRPVDHQRP
jgi:hypothetical protein